MNKSCRRVSLIVALPILFLLAGAALAADPLPPDLTLRDVAHSRGLRGGDLAEALDLPRSIDTDKPLVELGVTSDQLRDTLQQLGVAGKMASEFNTDADGVTPGDTIREIADALDIDGKALARDLGLDSDVDKGTPLAQFGIDDATLDEIVAHIRAREKSILRKLKYPLFALICLGALFWLVKFRRGKNPNLHQPAS